MDGFGDQFFAGSAFALNKHSAATHGHLRNKVQNFEYLLALADDVAVTEALLQRTAQLKVFAHQLPLLYGIPHDDDKLLVVPRLCDVVVRAFFDGRDCSFQGADGGDDHDRQGGINLLDGLLDLHAGLPGQHEVQQNGVIPILFDLLQTLFAVNCGICVQPFRGEQYLDAFTDFLFIVNDEDDTLSLRHSRSS